MIMYGKLIQFLKVVLTVATKGLCRESKFTCVHVSVVFKIRYKWVVMQTVFKKKVAKILQI